jgi:hypothetical protein
MDLTLSHYQVLAAHGDRLDMLLNTDLLEVYGHIEVQPSAPVPSLAAAPSTT